MTDEVLECWICGQKHKYTEKRYEKFGAVSLRAVCPDVGFIVHSKLAPSGAGGS